MNCDAPPTSSCEGVQTGGAAEEYLLKQPYPC